MLLTLAPLSATRRWRLVRLACLIHAASVQSEPGSNSPLQNGVPDRGGPRRELCPFNKESMIALVCSGTKPVRRPHTSSHCSVFKEPLVVASQPKWLFSKPLKYIRSIRFQVALRRFFWIFPAHSARTHSFVHELSNRHPETVIASSKRPFLAVFVSSGEGRRHSCQGGGEEVVPGGRNRGGKQRSRRPGGESDAMAACL